MGVQVSDLNRRFPQVKFTPFSLPNDKNNIVPTGTNTPQNKGILGTLKNKFNTKTKPNNASEQNRFNGIHGNSDPELKKMQKQQEQREKFQRLSQMINQEFQNMLQTSQQTAEVGNHGARGVAAAAA